MFRPLFIAIVCALAGLAPAFAQTRAVPTTRTEMQQSFAPLVKRTAPAVVNVFTRKNVQQARRMSPLFDDPFFRQFFDQRQRVQNSLGSGVIVRADGTVVTNHHVIEGADEIKVVLADRREFAATVLGDDPRTDIAVLKIDAKEALPFLEFHDSDDLEVGDLVLAIGNPFGVGQTVTSGIVSALARTQVGINDLNFFIQTDAAINPGNSGGALVSMDGKLVGVNSAIYSQSGGSIGIGFAIPSNMVASVVAGFAGGKRLVRPWLGATGQAVTSDLASSLGLKAPVGVLINDIYPKGPSARAGVQLGDVIRAIDGREVDDLEALRFRIATRRLGESVSLDVIRNGKTLSLTFPIEQPPELPPRDTTEISSATPLQGATVANLSPALADEMGLDLMAHGLVVTEVRRGSAAQRYGFKPGDIVQDLNGTKIGTVAEFQRNLDQSANRWRMTIRRGDETLAFSVGR